MDKKMFKVVIAGETRMYPEGTTYREIVDEISIHTETPVILVMVNGKLRELQKRLKSDCTLEFVVSAVSAFFYQDSFVEMRKKYEDT